MPSAGKNKDISQNSELKNSNIISFKGKINGHLGLI